MRLLIFGYFGSGNRGDEAILESFLSLYRKNSPGATFTVLSACPEETACRYGVEAVGKKNFSAVRGAMKKCDAVVAPGGGLLQDSTSAASAVYYSSIIFLARRMKKPVYMLSQGIGPLKSAPAIKAATAALKRCEKIWVRDVDAHKQLLAMGMKTERTAISADMVTSFSADNRAKNAEDVCSKNVYGLRIGISLRPDTHLPEIISAVHDAIAAMNERPASITLIPFDEAEDKAPCEDALKKLSTTAPASLASFPTSSGACNGAANTLNAYENIDVFVGMRLHSLVFSALANIPFVAISYDPKVAGFAKRCGMPTIENLREITAQNISASIAEITRNSPKAVHEKLAEAVREQKKTVEDMVRELTDTLEKRAEMNTLGVPVSGQGVDETIETITACVKNKKRMHIVTINPEMVLRAKNEDEFKTLLQGGTVNTPDGVGVRLAVRMKYGVRLEAVTGAALTHRLLEISRERNLRIFMIGGSEDVISKVAENISKHPGAPLIVGYHHGYIRGMDMKELAETIRSSSPDIIMAGMGVPMQEYWIRDFGDMTGANVFIGIGGMFDVLAGVKKRAPKIFQKMGMEWLWRLLSEPTRFKRIAPLPLYLPMAFMDRFHRR